MVVVFDTVVTNVHIGKQSKRKIRWVKPMVLLINVRKQSMAKRKLKRLARSKRGVGAYTCWWCVDSLVRSRRGIGRATRAYTVSVARWSLGRSKEEGGTFPSNKCSDSRRSGVLADTRKL